MVTTGRKAGVVALGLGCLAGVSVAMVPLPNADPGCATFASVQAAENDCTLNSGEFLMWGDFQPSNITNLTTVFGDDPGKARFGPYRCSTCGIGNTPGIGYVCKDSICPTFHSTDHLSSSASSSLPRCPNLRLSKEEMTCSDMQRICEDGGFGWLVDAQTYNTELGGYICAGCDFGSVYGTDPDEDSLLAIPMLAMYAAIGILLIIATIVDMRVFLYGGVSLKKVDIENRPDLDGDGNANTTGEWRNKYLLSLFGYTDHDGNRNTFWGQVCQNRFNCCGKSQGGTLNFISVLLMTLGTSALFKGGKLYPYTCYFNSKGSNSLSSNPANLTNYWEEEFTTHLFGFEDSLEGGIPTLDLTSMGYIISELAVVFYQFAVNLLSNALDDSGQMKPRNTLLLTIIFAAAFCASAVAYEWNNLKSEVLFINWVVGFLIVVIFVGPFTSGAAYLFAKMLVACKILKPPPTAPPAFPVAVGAPVMTQQPSSPTL